MINLERLFQNHFDTKEISDADFKKFSEDHLARLTANNPGSVYADQVSAVGAAHTAYFGAITDEGTARAVQEALTVKVDNAAEAFIAFVRRKRGAIIDAFGEDGPEYQEFFPAGLTEYTNADRADIEQLMERFIDAATRNAPPLADTLATEAAALRTIYQTHRTAQLGKKGQVGDLIDNSADKRTALELAILSSLHFIASKNPGDVAQCMAYFDQSFVRDAPTDNDGGSGGDFGGGGSVEKGSGGAGA